MKRLRAITELLFGSMAMWWVAVGMLVAVNVWQANEISDLKKQVRFQPAPLKQPEKTLAIVYILDETDGYYYKDPCYISDYRPGTKMPVAFSDVKGKYDPCPDCKPGTTEAEVIAGIHFEEHRRQVWREEHDFDEKVEESLRRQDLIPPY